MLKEWTNLIQTTCASSISKRSRPSWVFRSQRPNSHLKPKSPRLRHRPIKSWPITLLSPLQFLRRRFARIKTWKTLQKLRIEQEGDLWNSQLGYQLQRVTTTLRIQVSTCKSRPRREDLPTHTTRPSRNRCQRILTVKVMWRHFRRMWLNNLTSCILRCRRIWQTIFIEERVPMGLITRRVAKQVLVLPHQSTSHPFKPDQWCRFKCQVVQTTLIIGYWGWIKTKKMRFLKCNRCSLSSRSKNLKKASKRCRKLLWNRSNKINLHRCRILPKRGIKRRRERSSSPRRRRGTTILYHKIL